MPEPDKKTILIADDEEIICKPLSLYFEKKGYFVLTALNGEEAYQILQSAKIDIIVADLKMPKLDGNELTKRVKKSHPFVPVIILSGAGSIEEATFSIKSGAFDYIQKPIDNMDEMERVIRRAIEHSELEKQKEILQKNLQEKTQKLEEKVIEINRAKQQVEKQSFYLQKALEMIEEQNIQMEEDLKSAQRIQEELLPKELPNGEHFITSSYIPSGKVGGDMFDAFFDPSYAINLYIADVAGHGVGAAMVTVFLKKTITPFQKFTDMQNTPKEILSILNKEFLKEGFGKRLFVTMIYAIYNPPSRKFTYSSAGHPPFILKRKDENAKLFNTEGISLGWQENPNFEESSMILQPGDKLIFYTDGLIDAIDKSSDQPFSIEKILDIINSDKYSSTPPKDMIDDIVNCVKEKCDIKDDVSLFTLFV